MMKFPRLSLCIGVLVALPGIGTAVEPTSANPKAIQEVLAGRQKTARAAWWGFDAKDSTAALQEAIRSGAKKVIVEAMGSPWIIDKIQLADNQELVFEKGVEVRAKRGAFRGKGDALFTASFKKNVVLTGPGATLRMWREDYARPPYEKSEWRHAISILSCARVRISGLTVTESGGDGIYLGVAKKGIANTDVLIEKVVCDRNYRQGISVVSAENLRIENTVLRATAGTNPQAGIDFEPNNSRDRLVNCLMRNCLAENNAHQGYAIFLWNQTVESLPVSIRLENCRSLGNSSGLLVATKNGDRTAPRGSIDAVNCRFEGSQEAGIVILGKPAAACRVRLEKCEVVNAAASRPNLSPIMFLSGSGNTQKIGGVEFVQCTVADSRQRTPIGYQHRAGEPELADVTGTLTLQRDGKQVRYRLDQKLLDKWLDFGRPMAAPRR